MVVNGRIPGAMLGTIPGTNRQILLQLVPQTAALREAFRREFGKNLVVTDAYRDFDAQVRVKTAKGFLAATPGKSNHGLGRALDLGSMVNQFGTPEHKWMRENAPRFGWHHPLWARINGSKPEAWHWEAAETAVPVTNWTDGTGGTILYVPDVTLPDALTPEKDEDDDMPKLVQSDGRGWFLGAPGSWTPLTTGEEVDVALSLYGPQTSFNDRQTDVFRNMCLKAVTAVDDDIAAVDEAVWGTTVRRGDQQVSALQELADAKTIGLDIRDRPST